MSVFVHAVYDDRPKFLSIWKEFMEEERKDGSHIHATTRNLLHFAGFFDAYTQGQLFGFCMFCLLQPWEEPQGVMLIGERLPGQIWDTDRERAAVCWGIYVRPESRGKKMGLAMEIAGIPEILKLGFTHAETMVRLNNKGGEQTALSLGTTAVAQMHVVDIHELKRKHEEREDG